MNMLLETPVIISAVIGGVIALIALISNLLMSLSKHKYDKRNNYEKAVIDRLEKVYTPLIRKTRMNSNKRYLIDEDIQLLLEKQGYLLSDELFNDLSSLHIVEQQGRLQSDRLLIEEKNLKKKVLLKLNKEFNQLRDYNSKNFIRHTKKMNMSMYEKIIRRIGIFCIIITSSFYIFLAGFYIVSKINEGKKIVDNIYLNSIFLIYMVIVLGTSVIILVIITLNIIEFLMNRSGRKKGFFAADDYVPKTGNYYCRICNEKRYKYQNSEFDYCTEHSLPQILKSPLILFPWQEVK
ncbi:hypothetical protein PAECIP111893_01436 [Paenibacillus plantiphilus]|uniref:Uncharacterized protein n=1 Tax=Paenibacillus plantiphilus TaxID=2905650 RepID=A0ABN8G5U3_9BACL|nr:hypothetical protein [Paenibacillus plantiphilus]CAH1200548.1 hypothetical protein PAECIP111893_01436 [Paenibacillus plantiphilus]